MRAIDIAMVTENWCYFYPHMPKESPFSQFPVLKTSVLFPMQCAMKIVEARFEAMDFKKYGITVRQFWILLIASHRSVSQGVIADGLDINKNSMVDLIDDMESRHLVRRVRNPENRKECLIEIQPKGSEVFHSITRDQKDSIAEGFFPLAVRDVRKLWNWAIEIIETHHQTKQK
jgi:DNA-binding MarR family transcriptional regulator